MEIVAIVITGINLILLIFLIFRFRWNKYEEAIIKRLKKEISVLITELNRVTERNITLIENSIEEKGKYSQKDTSANKSNAVRKPQNETLEKEKTTISVSKNDSKSNAKDEKTYKKDEINNVDFNSFYQKTSYNVYNNLTKKLNNKKDETKN